LCRGLVNYDAYFAYYTEQCNLALHDGGRHTLVRTHRDIILIAQQLNADTSREKIKGVLGSRLPFPRPKNEDELLDSSIDLSARLLLMMEFGGHQYGFSGHKQLTWSRGPLQGFVKEYLRSSSLLMQERVKLGRIFNARNLGRIAGIEVYWTKNLCDHLRLIDEDRKVAIFHYTSFLECQRERYDLLAGFRELNFVTNSDSSIYPPGFIDETLQTVALLLPSSDKDVKAWFKKLSSSQNFDSTAIKCCPLRAEDRRIENFEFWRDRIVILKQFFDEAEPRTLSQWWHDRRKGVQWYTFWIAALILALTIFFGLIQSLEGALQAYKAFYPTT
jgi:hypothetical protein